jgi:DNA-binding NarL/FixJ family response regulator
VDAGVALGPAAPISARILLLTDQSLVGSAIARLLEQQPLSATVQVRVGGFEEAAQADSHDLIVCCLLTPASLDAAVASLTGSRPAVPVLVMAEAGQEPMLAACLRAGAAGVLSHSCTPADFYACAYAILGGGQWIGRDVVEWLLKRAHHADDAQGRPAAKRGCGMGRRRLLTESERSILDALAKGMSPAQIAVSRSNSEHTVRNHLTSAYRKLGVHSGREAVAVSRSAHVEESIGTRS